MTAQILVQLAQAGDTGAVLRWRGVCSSTNHTGALHLFVTSIFCRVLLLAGGDGPRCCVRGVSLFAASSDMSVPLRSGI